MENMLLNMGARAKEAARFLAVAETAEKNCVLMGMASAIRQNMPEILKANAVDLAEGKDSGLSGPLLERLTLNKERVEGMADGLEQIAMLDDPIGKGLGSFKNEDGLEISHVQVPLGVIGMIYESRPNVTADAAGLCLKAGNAVILRGGKEAVHSNRAIASSIEHALSQSGFPEGCVQLLSESGREVTQSFMALDSLDVLIPRGGKGLKSAVREHARVPVIMTGMGLCHAYIDETFNLDSVVSIVVNAKTQRPSTCNSIETLLVHSAAAPAVLPVLAEALVKAGVELRGDDRARSIVPSMLDAKEEDWSTEYLALILSVKVVDCLEDAMDHIHRYGTGHSETILTENYGSAQKFLDGVDAAAVYANASTRFTDGGVFGFGAEMGISTQKLHARGPMGVTQLTTGKFIIRGSGQIRG